MVLREQDKHFLASLYIAVGVVFTWKGLWDGSYAVFGFFPVIPEASIPWILLFLGFSMLTVSSLIFNEFDPLGGIKRGVTKTLHSLQARQDKKNFSLHYYDEAQKKEQSIPASLIKKIEKDALVVVMPHEKKELFIPLHRIKEIRYKGERYWRL